ncbi:hypothetical protein [Thermophilibacter immobilis]|uniref:hypothetical protein n=1 Tax=Thermophilibacter immobilis TaxID=2779519 RepID=UPI0038CD299C
MRFRSVPGSARDIGFVFLAMCVGLACGMGYLVVGAITTILLGGIYLIYQLSGFGSGNGPLLDRAIHISIPEDLDYTSLFDDIFERYLSERELASVSTANMGSVFKLVYNVRLASNISEKALIDEIRCAHRQHDRHRPHRRHGHQGRRHGWHGRRNGRERRHRMGPHQRRRHHGQRRGRRRGLERRPHDHRGPDLRQRAHGRGQRGP